MLGFTIVELIVAAAITLVLLGLMVQVTFSVIKTFDKVTGSLTTKTQATTALEYLRRDFQSIVWKRDQNVWLLATVQPDQVLNGGRGDTNIAAGTGAPDWAPTLPKPGNANAGQGYSSLRLQDPNPTVTNGDLDLTDYRFGQAGVWLRFFTQGVSELGPTSAPIAVAYQIVRMPPEKNSAEYRYLFFRSVVRPGPTTTTSTPRSVLNAGFNLAMPRNVAGTSGYNDDNNINSNSGISEPGGLRRPDREMLLATNVIDFGVRFWSRDPLTGTLQLEYPATSPAAPSLPKPSNVNLAYAATTLSSTAAGALNINPGSIPYGQLAAPIVAPNLQLRTGYPDFVDIMLRVLTDEGARLIEAYEHGDSSAPPKPAGSTLTDAQWKSQYWWTLAEAHSEVFVERIPITVRPF